MFFWNYRTGNLIVCHACLPPPPLTLQYFDGDCTNVFVVFASQIVGVTTMHEIYMSELVLSPSNPDLPKAKRVFLLHLAKSDAKMHC